MYMTKAETWKLAKDLGQVNGQDVFETVRVESHTDYNGNRSQWNEWGYGKLDNPASKLRAEGYKEAKENGWI
jgi:7-cyano-7-deazaguanine synthase